MGNTTSNTKNSNLATEIDRIASKYILSQNFNDMNKLSEKNHCDKLVILTAKIINKNLSPLEQKKVVERIKPPTPPTPPTPTPPLADIKGDEQPQPSADVKTKTEQSGGQENDEKEEDCVKIAKFYVKIAHLYAAIMKTINPVIISTDENGKTKKYDLMNKQTMPTETEIKSIQHNNFCTMRINTLIQESDYNVSNPRNKILTIKPRFCDMNYDKTTKQSRRFYVGEKDKKQVGGVYDNEEEDEEEEEMRKKKKQREKKRGQERETGEGAEEAEEVEELEENKEKKEKKEKKELQEKKKKSGEEEEEEKKKETPIKETPISMDSGEIGIPELMKLYYDVYDENKGDFVSMSPEMRKTYQADVETFYKAFTGKEIETDENGDKIITTFEQIPLHEFHKNDGCKPDGIYSKPYEGSLIREFGKENLFEKYANHVNKMMNTMNTNQDKLLVILKKLFKFQKPKKPAEEEAKPTPEEAKPTPEEAKPTPEEAKPTQEQAKPAEEIKPNIAAPLKKEENPQIIDKEPIPIVYQAPTPVALQASAAQQQQQAPAAQQQQQQALAEAPKVPLPVASAQQQPEAPLPVASAAQNGGAEEIDDVIIHPDLDEELLQSLINTARKLIVNLYITCENDFLEGIHIFEAIVATQLGKTINSQVKILDELTLEYLAGH